MFLARTPSYSTLTTTDQKYGTAQSKYWTINSTFPCEAVWFTSGILGRPLVNGVDFIQKIFVDTGLHPAGAIFDWKFPVEILGLTGPVYSAPQIIFGLAYGGNKSGIASPASTPLPTPVQLSALTELKVKCLFGRNSNNYGMNNGQSSAFIEIYPSNASGKQTDNDTHSQYEFSAYWYADAATVNYWGGATFGVGGRNTRYAYSQPGGFAGFMVKDTDFGTGANGRILVIPATGSGNSWTGTEFQGVIDVKDMFDFAATKYTWSDSWYLNGVEINVENLGNGGGFFLKDYAIYGWS